MTLFNRRLTAPGLFPEAEHVTGDRDGGLDALRGRRFDAVVDTLRDDARLVGAAAELLGPAVERYCFVSSISVYADVSRAGWDERSPVREEGDDYGARKVRCERAVEAGVGDRALLLRPGLIVGPWDPTNRFTYWVTRLARGGEILAPGPPELPVQVIDARDLAAWTVQALEEGRAGVFNAVGPAYPLTLRDVLSGGEVVWADPAWLEGHGVTPWLELPLWVGTDPEGRAHGQGSAAKAIAAGLTFRPLADTLADTLAWAQAMDEPPGDAGLPEEREQELLEALR